MVGDHSSATVLKQSTEGVTVAQFLSLLAELRATLGQSNLDPDMCQVDVKVVGDQANKAQPSSAIIVSKLKGITEVLTEAGKAVATAAPLVSLAQKALAWAQQLF